MRENRTYGSEGGAAQINASFLPLSINLPIKQQALSAGGGVDLAVVPGDLSRNDGGGDG